MSVNRVLRMAMAKMELNQTELAEAWGISRQAINNKFMRNTWSAEEMVRLADTIGAKLILRFPDGQELPLLPDKKDDPKTGENDGQETV